MNEEMQIFIMKDYGKIILKLAEKMDGRNISRNKLAKLIGCKFDVIDRYYNGTSVERVDLDILAKICYVLQCGVSDLIEYIPPKT